MQKRTAEIQNPHAHLRSLGAFEVLIDAKLAPSESSVRQTLQQSQQQDRSTAFIGGEAPRTEASAFSPRDRAGRVIV
ncbi:MAG: hypothetical protein PUP92_23465 [Rhizonema sp. PD38]|nr:hypothetical protein [Rhizonema sp. PD38]